MTDQETTESSWLAEIQALKEVISTQAKLQNQSLQKISLSLQALQETRDDQQQIMRAWLLGLLENYDSFRLNQSALDHYRPVNRLFRHSRPEDIHFIQHIQQGQQITHRRLERLMEQCQLKPIECLDKQFDPTLMIAVEIDSQPDIENGLVVAELRPGFYWRDQLLRTAEVKVNRTGESNK